MNGIFWDKHAVILGTTDTGKTYYAASIFSKLKERALFINTAAEPIVEKKAGVVIDTAADIIPALQEHKKVCYNIEKPEDLKETLDILRPIGEQINEDGKRKRWVTLFIDEVHLWGGKAGEPYLNYFWTNGLRYGIVAVAISQRAALVPQVVLTQSNIYAFLGLTQYERNYLERYGFDFEKITAWTDKKYHVYVQKGDNVILQKPVKLS